MSIRFHSNIWGGLESTRNRNCLGDGRRIEITQRILFTRVRKIGTVIVAVRAIAGGLGGFVTGSNNASAFLRAPYSVADPRPGVIAES
jgi:hypothetical protein